MSQAKVLFTVLEDEKLVEIVAKFPCIYDRASPVYKDQNLKDNAWREVGEFVQRSAQDCKKRWRNIKDTYDKRKKKGKGPGSSSSSKGKKWALADLLTFLESTRQTISNIPDDSSTQQDCAFMDDCLEEKDENLTSSVRNDRSTQKTTKRMPPLRKCQRQNDKIIEMIKRRRLEKQDIINNLSNRDDDVDLFFRSIAMSVKKLRPDLINQAKLKSLQMLFELEHQNKQQIDSPQIPSNDIYTTSPSPSSMSLSTDHESFDDTIKYV